MTLRLLDVADMRGLQRLLRDLGYVEAGLRDRFDVARPPAGAALARFLHATAGPGALPQLARLLLAGQAVPLARARSEFPARLLELGGAAGLWRTERSTLVAGVTVVPRGELLFVSDALAKLGSAEARDFVLPAGTHAASHLLALTVRRRVGSTLDLGTGCGEHALAAAAHSGQVVASDISAAAIRYAEFNARLNDIDNVECVTGDLFGPVAGRRFDLIVSNPPFVPGPRGTFQYRDAGEELDGLCARLLRDAPAHLADGGILQMLCEWVETEETPWQARLNACLEGLGCDCWVLHSPPQAPAPYATLRLGEVTGPGRGEGELAAWLDYFATRRVKAIHPAVVVLRRRAGRNWLQVQPLARELRGAAGEAILRGMAACDYLVGLDAGDALLGAVLSPAPGLRLEQSHGRTERGWQLQSARAWLAGPLPLDAELDPAAMFLLREFDGVSPARECIERLAAQLGGEPGELGARCLPLVRFFVERGFLLPPAA